MDSFTLLKFWKGGAATATAATNATTATTTVTTSTSDSEPDAGPFFDLEFALPSDDDDDDVIEDDEEEEEAKTTNEDDDVYIRGQIVEINGSDEESEHEITGITKSGQFPIPESLLRSATKLRVLMLGLKRSKSQSTPKSNSNRDDNTPKKKLFTIKLRFKSDENPIMALLNRNVSNSKEEKKEKVKKYVRMLYEKAKKKKEKEKETAVVHSMPAAASNGNINGGVSVRSGKRRDDSLLEIQDGIQSAILHCKRSFNSSTAPEELDQAVEPSAGPTEEMAAAASNGGERNGVIGM